MSIDGGKQAVLFLCTGNSCRSQMAEGWLRHLAGDRYTALSAGTLPQDVNPVAVSVMRDIGIDISKQKSNHVKDYLGAGPIQYAVFVCSDAEKRCPGVFPFPTKRMSWPFEDPAKFEGSDADRYRKFEEVREQIGARIREWLEQGADVPADQRL